MIIPYQLSTGILLFTKNSNEALILDPSNQYAALMLQSDKRSRARSSR